MPSFALIAYKLVLVIPRSGATRNLVFAGHDKNLDTSRCS